MKLDRKRKTKDPCPGCFLHLDLCLCADIPKLNLQTRLSLIVHYKELRRTTNTGRLAVSALENSEMRIRGLVGQELDLGDLADSTYTNLFLYPAEGAKVLNQELLQQLRRPLRLIVPDGNWRQASKVHYRHHELKAVLRVVVPAVRNSSEFLRVENTEEGMATLQAIAVAIGEIEGPEAGEALMKLYDLKLQRTLQGRGRSESKLI